MSVPMDRRSFLRAAGGTAAIAAVAPSSLLEPIEEPVEEGMIFVPAIVNVDVTITATPYPSLAFMECHLEMMDTVWGTPLNASTWDSSSDIKPITLAVDTV